MSELVPLPDDREEWLQLRRTGIGGSDVAGILGVSPWSSPYEVWASKVLDHRIEQTEQMEWGTRLESAVADRFADEHDEGVASKPRHMYRLGNLLANPDRVLFDKVHSAASNPVGLLEVKTAGTYSVSAWENGPPVYYQLQVQHYLHVLGLEHAYIAVLFGGNRYQEYEITYDPEAMAKILPRLEQFWQLVETRTPPDVMASDSELLANLYPVDDGETVTASPELFELHTELTQLKLNLKAAKDQIGEQINLIEAQVKAELGTASIMVDEIGRPLWSWIAGKDRQTIPAANITEMIVTEPETFAKYGTTKPGNRTLRMKALKDD